MLDVNSIALFIKQVKPKTLRKFVKNLGAPRYVVALAKGMAINCERRLAGHAEICHKSTSN